MEILKSVLMAHITAWSKMESVSPSILRNLGLSVLVGEGSKTDIHEPGVLAP